MAESHVGPNSTGKEFEDATGLYYFGARWYDPELGVWLTPDAAGQYFNPYSFAGGAPILGVDADGNWFLIDDAIAAAASFTIGYVAYGVSTGDWGWDAVATGAISAAVGWAVYNTAGAAAGALGLAQGSLGSSLFIGGVGGTVAGGLNTAAQSLYQTGSVNWNEVGKGALAGGAGGLVGGGLAGSRFNLGRAGNSAIAGFVGGGTSSVLHGKNFFGSQAWAGAGYGYAGGVLSGALERQFKPIKYGTYSKDTPEKRGSTILLRNKVIEFLTGEHFGHSLVELGEGEVYDAQGGENSAGVRSREDYYGREFVRLETKLTVDPMEGGFVNSDQYICGATCSIQTGRVTNAPATLHPQTQYNMWNGLDNGFGLWWLFGY